MEKWGYGHYVRGGGKELERLRAGDPWKTQRGCFWAGGVGMKVPDLTQLGIC